ncbi:helix-turn-helix domain-containing protein [Clostridium sp. P21]|uniref:Helix-turn-helix domain-containing protein n=1 Tax=Clostridium muellerianum TaxID=2716538 RepID=A0A7Y0EEW1_9CLOT|nr:helix-turn-helix domain-containing protein [Clostridium muellerianum]NMM62239.1 helix-turn-helix domain-containing protein [Clostridium muellerianum]
MITLNEKQQIILKYYREGKSQRSVQRETGIARDTIRKYIRQYDEKLRELNNLQDRDDVKKADIISDIVEAPKYHGGKKKEKL